MIGAMVRWVKATLYYVTGNIDAARRVLDTNPYVVKAKYDEIIVEKTKRIQQYKQAVAGLIAQQEIKMAKVKTLTEEVQKLEKLKAGALAKAQKEVERLKASGAADAAIKSNAEVVKCQAAYHDFSTTLEEKSSHIAGLEKDIEEYQKTIGQHKVQLEHLLRDLEKIKTEAVETVADVLSASHEKELADTLAGISEDKTGEELQRMRTLRHEIKAEVRISKELAGTDTKAQEAEFMDYATKSEINDEFDALIGLAGSKDGPAAAKRDAAEKTKLPE